MLTPSPPLPPPTPLLALSPPTSVQSPAPWPLSPLPALPHCPSPLSTPPPGDVPPHLQPTLESWTASEPFVLSLARLDEFTSALTTSVSTTLSGSRVRAVHSSGGAAGGVISEGQGYGMLLAGATLAALPQAHGRRTEVIDLTLEYFNGWRRMCELTNQNSCQQNHFCGNQGQYKCLPSWKFDDDLTVERGTGSAPDGDEDFILGACGCTGSTAPPSMHGLHT